MRLTAYVGMVITALLFSGCSLKPLVIHDEDSFPTHAGKVIIRTALAPISFGATERAIGRHAEEEDYWKWYGSLSPEAKLQEDQRRHERQLAILGGRRNCTTQMIGNMAYTNCN